MKKLIWIGSSYEDLKEFPPPVRNAVAYALYFAQTGKKHPHTKVLSGWEMQASLKLERLLRFLNDLGQDVYISIVPRSKGQAILGLGTPHLMQTSQL